MNREKGFYWCDLGKVRGLLSGWAVCFWEPMDKLWHVPYYNDKVPDDFFDSIDEIPISRNEEQFIGILPYIESVKNGEPLSEFQHNVFKRLNIPLPQ